MPTARHEYTQEELDEAVAAEREKYDVLFNAFHEACAAGALARREIDLALPAMREYARKNPKHHFSTDLTEQDPDGAHAWLERNDKPNDKGVGLDAAGGQYRTTAGLCADVGETR